MTHHDMLNLLRIKLFGQQPTAKVSDQMLEELIERDYKSAANFVKTKLKNISSDNKAGKNRIAAGVLKLADKNFDTLDALIEKANSDSRDIMTLAEYPRCAKLGFDELDKKQMKRIYLAYFIEYSNWLNKQIN